MQILKEYKYFKKKLANLFVIDAEIPHEPGKERATGNIDFND